MTAHDRRNGDGETELRSMETMLRDDYPELSAAGRRMVGKYLAGECPVRPEHSHLARARLHPLLAELASPLTMLYRPLTWNRRLWSALRNDGRKACGAADRIREG